MTVLRVARVWGDRVLDVRVLAAAASWNVDGQRLSLPSGAGELLLQDGTVLRCAPIDGVEPVKSAVFRETDWSFPKLVTEGLLVAVALIAIFSFTEEFVPEPEQVLKPRPIVSDVVKPSAPIELAKKLPSPTPTVSPSVSVRAGPSQRRSAEKPGLIGALEALKRSSVFEGGGLDRQISQGLEKLQGDNGVAGPAGFAGLGPRDGAGLPGNGGANLTIGGTVGARAGNGGGPPGGNLKHRIAPIPDQGPSSLSDGLDKSVVSSVIKRHMSEIKFCYEQGLTQNQALRGKVAVLFTIDAAGAVADANVAESTLEDATVEGCMLNRIKRWKFPEPRGGGVVSVTYPWVLMPAGSDE